MAGIDIVPMYVHDRGAMLRRVGSWLEREFRTTVRYRNPWFDPEIAFDAARGQYRAAQLLKALLNDPEEERADRILGIASMDLSTPVLTYVFGEAQLGGRAAIVSSYRLRNEVYGLPGKEDLLFDRLRKEAMHELGHTYGLLHCPRPTCVMRASTYAEEIELKGMRFCAGCHAIVSAVGAAGARD